MDCTLCCTWQRTVRCCSPFPSLFKGRMIPVAFQARCQRQLLHQAWGEACTDVLLNGWYAHGSPSKTTWLLGWGLARNLYAGKLSALLLAWLCQGCQHLPKWCLGVMHRCHTTGLLHMGVGHGHPFLDRAEGRVLATRHRSSSASFSSEWKMISGLF